MPDDHPLERHDLHRLEAAAKELDAHNEPPIIDHNPDETRPTNTIWWIAWGIVALLWIWFLTYREFNRDALALGFITGMFFAIWGIEITGNKLPEWMIPRPKKRYLPRPIAGEPVFGKNAGQFVIPTLVALCLSLLWIVF